MNEIILLKLGEMVLKGLNRRSFEDKLQANLHRRLRPFGQFRVYTRQSATYVEPIGEGCDVEGAYEALKHVFGIVGLSLARPCGKDKDAILACAKEFLDDQLRAARTFKVETKRADKNFPMTSIQLSQYVGGELHEAYDNLEVDVHHPDLTVHVEIREKHAYVHGPAISGAGGLPVGTGGHAVSLLSGGLDSTLAVLVTGLAMKMLDRPMTDIIAVTMPCFGTTDRTRNNAVILAERMGAVLKTVDISASVRSHFKDIGHDMDDHSVTFENAQARERTQVLMDIANRSGGLVIGTGDLSELALGWCTYNGDHMSMYAVNCSIPKTLVRYLVGYLARDNAEKDEALHDVLEDILATPVSPELLPAVQGQISQRTEDLVGPYELHDFFLYYMLRWGFSPGKIYRLALYALGRQYSREVILKWLKVFYRRFFSQQFKRSCVPDGPKVGTVALSPRGDWRMPSDASWTLWQAEDVITNS